MTKIKICGLRRIEDIHYVNILKPDYAGFIFVPESKRHISFKDAASLLQRLSPGIVSVGVFTDEPPENIAKLLNDGIIKMAQLHGNEDGKYINFLKKLTNKPIIKAFEADSTKTISKACNSPADFIMFDSGGGTGKQFDHSLLYGLKRPFFLAGGLDPLNIKNILNLLHPFAVDVSSGVEKNGIKSFDKIKSFIETVRGCQ